MIVPHASKFEDNATSVMDNDDTNSTWLMDKNSVRDVSGFYVLCVFFRLFFLLRDYWPNRKDASMITWIQVVGASMIKFFLVSSEFFSAGGLFSKPGVILLKKPKERP